MRWILLGALLCLVAAWAQARENHALLIGASTYPALDERFWLVGPGNDVDLVRTYLISNPHVPFAAENITTLADGVAGGTPPTLQAIRDAMADLAARVGPDDFVYLHFSGHGSQAPARDPDSELDGLDELFLPVDIGAWDDTVGEVENALVDDEIGQMIGAIRARGATVWAVFDSCHSGTVTRAAPAGDDMRLRQLAPGALGIPEDAMQPVVSRGLPAAENPADPTGTGGAFIAFYAAQTNETTPEKRLPRGMPGRRSQGVFTFTLFQALAERPGITYRQLGQDVLRRYAVANLARSTPLFEGDLDLAVFGNSDAQAVRQWPVSQADGTVTIPAGRLHGLEDGMELILLASPADADEAALARLRIDFAETFQAELAGAPTELPRGAWVRQVDASASFSLTVAGPEPDSPAATAYASALRVGAEMELFSPRLRFVDAGAEADLRLAPGPHGDSLLVLPGTGILSQAGLSLTPEIRTGHKSRDGLARDLADTLDRIARVQNLLKLGGAFAGDALDVDVDLQTRSPDSPRLASLDTLPPPRLVPDDEVHVLVRNHEAFPLDLNVLYVGADYAITHMFAGRLQPGDRLKQGLLRITDASFGRDRLVMILTPAARGTPLEDLGFLAQDKLPPTRALGGTGFADTLAEAGFGHRTRAATPMGSPTPDAPAPAMLVYDIDTRPAE